jgi:hypothetical protein
MHISASWEVSLKSYTRTSFVQSIDDARASGVVGDRLRERPTNRLPRGRIFCHAQVLAIAAIDVIGRLNSLLIFNMHIHRAHSYLLFIYSRTIRGEF